jgi:hypothetical protein
MSNKEQILGDRVKEICNAAARGEEPPKAGMNLALQIMASASEGRIVRNGEDYSTHPISVAFIHAKTDSYQKKIGYVMHDVIEDTRKNDPSNKWTLEDLKTCQFEDKVIAIVDSMTRREGELYFDFIKRCSLNPDGIDGKLGDIEHNMMMSRERSLPSAKALKNIDLYVISMQYLLAVKKEEIEAGSPMVDFLETRRDLLQNGTMELIKQNTTENLEKLGYNYSAQATPSGYVPMA